MSELKVEHAELQPGNPRVQNKRDKSVTADTSHVLMSPYVAAAAVGFSRWLGACVGAAPRYMYRRVAAHRDQMRRTDDGRCGGGALSALHGALAAA